MKVAAAAVAHRALADEMRLRLFDLIADSSEPLDIARLARAVGLHPNTVRSHLKRLEAAGLIASEIEIRSSRGRPRQLFTAGPAAADIGPAMRDYRLLATMLAGLAAAGKVDAEAVGRSWGSYLAERPAPGEPADPGAALDMIERMMDRMGFEPAVERPDGATELHLRNCPFRDVARRYPEIVCSMHRGLLRGALSEVPSGLDVTEMRPFVNESLCIARIEQGTGGQDGKA